MTCCTGPGLGGAAAPCVLSPFHASVGDGEVLSIPALFGGSGHIANISVSE